MSFESTPQFSRLVDLIDLRVQEAETVLGLSISIPWTIGEYPHFNTARGFGVTFFAPVDIGAPQKDALYGSPIQTKTGPQYIHMMYAEKFIFQPLHRIDAIIRHEIGHIVDMILSERQLHQFAASRITARSFYKRLPPAEHAELRADALAEFIWGTPIHYDAADVQSTQVGTIGRPSNLQK